MQRHFFFFTFPKVLVVNFLLNFVVEHSQVSVTKWECLLIRIGLDPCMPC